ncbi:hypothetical protein HAX54_004665 [Datura stramonium]|uniref:Uncharacterized protein n=1 Tax=Datura stramonium TaxID=4076 RepID=A0ABS8T847_DATST|nr:hypothetical protein [Datura stramonium]
MASNQTSTQLQESKFTLPMNDLEQQQVNLDQQEEKEFDYSKRSQWLRSSVLGANDGLVSTASLMMGVGAVKKDIKWPAHVPWPSENSPAYSQLDRRAQMKREKRRNNANKPEGGGGDEDEKAESLPNPAQAAASISTKDYKVRIGVVVAAVTLALMVFGWLGAVLGKAPVLKSSVRVLFGGYWPWP